MYFFVRILIAFGTEIRRAGEESGKSTCLPFFKLLPLRRTVQLFEAKLDVSGVLRISLEKTYANK